ncbi:MAG: glycoside hydrolase family 172 protein [Bacteroidales bacterium]
MKTIIHFTLAAFALAVLSTCKQNTRIITFTNLLDEMTDLKRLTVLPDQSYRAIQLSSYDRRSKTPGDTLWFANEDGFGGEPVPGFEKVLKQPDSSGIGEYLICDIQKPGVIQRLWTAAMTGKIRFYLDNIETPVYEGDAADFFWKPLEKIAGINDSARYAGTFRQFDATYLPIPFAKSCRIEWIGNIKDPHFYHVGVRVYNQEVKLEAFNQLDSGEYLQKLNQINRILQDPESINPGENDVLQKANVVSNAGSAKDLMNLEGAEAIEYFRVKIKSENIETALRRLILNIYFDNAAIPQVQAPIGDFFGAAPGLNPYQSLPFSVLKDSSMICRFVMPFKNSARIKIENHSTESTGISLTVKTSPYHWEEGKSMYFMTRWKISHDLTARNSDAQTVDIPFLKAKGSGRMVGAAAYIYNPCNATNSWGNWWGEGDEKIFVDRDSFPSFFGTGSEDYFNYSWSSPEIFSYPYCGQPRNDGPCNRGYVSNFRWHIADDIRFSEKIDFSMELRHHDVVPHFDYGRIVYFYALPGLSDDYKKIEASDIPDINYLPWSPKAYLGSAGFSFIQAEKLAEKNENARTEKGKIWAEENILVWNPKQNTEKLKFTIQSNQNKENTRIGFTIAHCPDGGTISLVLNGKNVKFDNLETLNLSLQDRTVLDNHFSEPVNLKKGKNEIIMTMPDADGSKKALVDFIWLR